MMCASILFFILIRFSFFFFLLLILFFSSLFSSIYIIVTYLFLYFFTFIIFIVDRSHNTNNPSLVRFVVAGLNRTQLDAFTKTGKGRKTEHIVGIVQVCKLYWTFIIFTCISISLSDLCQGYFSIVKTIL